MAIIKIIAIKHNTPSSITAILSIKEQQDEINAEVSENVNQYLTTDRCDAFIMGLLYFAMSHGYDFESQIPISEELYYNLENHFIDALAHNGSGLHRTMLFMPTIPAPSHTGNIVATGISCGVDCLYTIHMHENIQIPDYRITHLGFYNVGSHQTGSSNEHDNQLYKGRYQLCKSFAEEYGYTFYTLKSNIHEFIDKYGGYSHVNNHSYMAAYSILLLQKGISRYYYSAGYPYTDFRVNKTHKGEELDSAMYDLLTFYTISGKNIKVYLAGGNIKRIDKTKILCNYPPAFKYLNVCVREAQNDSTCFKCIRTMLSIDAVGKIDNFKNVFDVSYYKAHKKHYIQSMWISATFFHDELSQEIIPYYKDVLTLKFKFSALINKFINAIQKRL